MKHVAALGLAVALVASCTTRRASTRPRPPAPPDAATAAYYAVPGAPPAIEATLERTERGHRVHRATLAPRDVVPDAPAAKDPIRFAWYEPRGGAPGPRPLVLVSPILGSDSDFVEGFAEDFADRGWHAAIVKRPKLAYEASRPLSQVEEGLRLAVSRQRQVVDAFLEDGRADPRRLATFGISAGGILNAALAGADDRFGAHVFALAGGPLADVLVESDEGSLEKLVRQAAEQVGCPAPELRERLRAVIRTDPVALASRVRREDVLMFVARFDQAVPTAWQESLWRALGEPERVDMPLGHYTSILALPWVRARTVSFLEARFAARTGG
jgi:dienelactone hydrolase